MYKEEIDLSIGEEKMDLKTDIAGVNIFLTRRCNLRCTYCFVDKSKGKDITSSILESSIEFINLCAQKSEKKIHVGYIGGEPLLNWQLFQNTTNKLKALSTPVDIGFTTNGTLINFEKVEFIKQNNIRVVLSFDGDITSMHDRLFFNGKPSYQAVHKGVELLLSNDIPFFVQLTITPFNVTDFYYNVKHLVNLGITKLIFGFGIELDWKQTSLLSLSKNLSEVFHFYKTIYRNQYDVTLKYLNDEILSYILSQSEHPRIKQVCPMANEVFAIDVDGTIYPCQALVNNPEWSIGNVLTGFNDKKRRLAASIHNENMLPCKSCKLMKFCRKCPRSNYLINGTPFIVDGFSCYLGKLMYTLIKDFVKTMVKEKNLRFLSEYGALIEQWELKGGL